MRSFALADYLLIALPHTGALLLGGSVACAIGIGAILLGIVRARQAREHGQPPLIGHG